MRNPKVTIFIPIYNAEPFLAECIKSSINQDYDNIEILCIDDGSTDCSIKIIKSFNDKRIRLIEKKHNYIETINLGFTESRGEYIARMDADDIMYPRRISTQVNYMERRPHLIACGSLAQCFGDKNHIYGKSYQNTQDFLYGMLNGNPIVHPSVIFNKKHIHKYNLQYKNDYIYGEDYQLWYDICKIEPFFSEKIFIIPEILLNYRISSIQLSSTKKMMLYSLGYIIAKKFFDLIIKKFDIYKDITASINSQATPIFSRHKEGIVVGTIT